MSKGLDHAPMRKPRASFFGESVYAARWVELMAGEARETWRGDFVQPFEDVLGEFDRRSTYDLQRCASVLASVVSWLGTNCGQAMLAMARTHIAMGKWGTHDAYLLSWTLENARHCGINGGIRTLEHLLSPGPIATDMVMEMQGFTTKVPELLAGDLEAVDHLMLWLATADGQAFMARCDAEVAILKESELRVEREQWQRSMCGAERHGAVA